MSFDYSNLAYIDTETTGLDIEYHSVWEVAIIVDDVEHVWQVQTSKRSIEHAEDIALKLNGFHERYDPATALGPLDHVMRFRELLDGRSLVGANPSFDAERLARTHRALVSNFLDYDDKIEARQAPWRYRMYDVSNLVAGLRRAPIVGLADSARAVGIDPDGERYAAHTALGDARLARDVFKAVMQ